MATVVDALTVSLGLDSSAFLKAQKQASDSFKKTGADAQSAMKTVEAGGKAAAEALDSIAKKALLVFSIFTAGKGLKDFVSDLTATDAALGRTARNMDTSVKTLSTFQGMAEVAGGSADGIAQSFNNLVGQLEQFSLTGQSSVIPVFRALGINVADAQGHMRSMTDIMADLNLKFSHMDPARANAIGHMLGLDQGTINLLEMAPEKYRRLYEEQQKFAANDADIKAAQERQKEWRSLMIISESLGRTILTTLSPAIVDVLERLRDWASANKEWIATTIVDKVKDFSTWVKGIDWTSALKGIAEFIAQAQSLVSEVKKVWAEFDTWSEKVTGQSGVKTALELLASYMAGSWVTRILGVFGKLSSGWLAMLLRMGFGSTAAFLAALSAGFLGATTGPANAGEPQIDAQGNLHFPDGSVRPGGFTGQPTAHIGDRLRHRGNTPFNPNAIGNGKWKDAGATQGEVANYIRQAAARRHIDPEIALRVSKSEGFSTYTGDYGTSFGPFQLHYGGSGIPGMNSRGLGDDFTRDTGKDARDPKTWKAQVDYAMERAARAGWGDWHGARAVGIGRMQGIGTYRGPVPQEQLPSGAISWGKDAQGNRVPMDAQGHPFAQHQSYMNLPSPGELAAHIASIRNDNSRSNSYSSQAHIAEMHIHTQATDGQGIADTIGPALQRNRLVTPVNFGFV